MCTSSCELSASAYTLYAFSVFSKHPPRPSSDYILLYVKFYEFGTEGILITYNFLLNLETISFMFVRYNKIRIKFGVPMIFFIDYMGDASGKRCLP
jgi:hypothetical protein